MTALRKRLTYRVELPGGQLRLREMVLYVSERCATAKRFGKIKLNKIIWKADFDAYAARRVPVTGRAYQRLKFGPAAIEMAPLYGEMLQDGLITIKRVDLGDGYVEQRTIPEMRPELKLFSQDDLDYVSHKQRAEATGAIRCSRDRIDNRALPASYPGSLIR